MKKENEELGMLLFKTFFYNHNAYAIQESIEGSICFITKHERIDANKINYYIDQKKSILAYQQKFDKLNWVCLDFDIVKNILKGMEYYDFISDEKYKKIMLEEVDLCCKFLDDLDISYVVEYSGNRGIHLWIFFEFPITKKLGYTIIEKIVNETPFRYIKSVDSPIAIDKFPKVPSSKNNIVGKGVKIPLSYHMKSNSYSYIIEKLSDLKKIEHLTDIFIQEQIQKLRSIKRNDIRKIVSKLSITEISSCKEYERMDVSLSERISSEDIVSSLSRSSLYKYLFDNLDSLNENERRILVGTFSRIQYGEDSEYGIKLLKKLFASTANYNQELTDIKIDLLKNLYPPNINYIEKILNQNCRFCEENEIQNSIELLTNVTIRKLEYLNEIVNWSVHSEINYLNYNDEVPLSFIEDELKCIDYTEIESNINDILNNGVYYKPIAYKYDRNEGDRNRTLYSLSAKDRVVTTSLMKYIYDIIGVDTISSISYSYRINSNSKTNIFMNWNTLWMEFIKAVQSCANHESYDEYYVIKLDVKSFYDSIDLTLLKEIMTAKSQNGLHSDFVKLSIDSLSQEVKERYKNAVNYLIKTCKDISGKHIGVPQGPAYARYMAELYLAAIDEYLVLNLDLYYDFACRYVDDYYIFIKDPSKGEKLKDSLILELSKMYLDINSKFVYGILKDIKYEINIKNQVEKYFIDGIDNGTPENVKYEAKKILTSMYRNFIDNDDIKDFPFFLTHLWDEEFIERKSEVLIKKVKASDIGRGSLFKHFYNRVATKFSDMNFYDEISGLLRSNYITALIRNCDYNFNYKNEFVENYLKLELKDYERIELIKYILIKGINFRIDLFTQYDYNYVIMLIESITEIKWTEQLFENTLLKVQDISDKKKAIMLIEKILSNSKNIPNIDILIATVYAIIHENDFYELNDKDSQYLYNVISFSTLFIKSIDQVKSIWCKLLLNEKRDIKTNEWLKYIPVIDSNNIVSSTVSGVLTQLFSRNSFEDNRSASKIELEYAYYLFLELSNYDDKHKYINKDLFKLVKEVAKKQKAISLLWCCEDAEYFPDKITATKNIEYNDRLVLIKGSEILVRGDANCFEGESYREEKLSDTIKSCYNIYPINSTLTNFNEVIHENDIIDVLAYSHEIIQLIKKKLINIFEKGSLVKEKVHIEFSYSKADNNFILNKTEKIDAKIDSVIDKMIDLIAVSLSKHTFQVTGYELLDSDMKKNIVPNRLLSRNNSAKRMYFEKLCKEIYEFKKSKSNENISMYMFEAFKIEALKSVISEYKKEIPQVIKDMNDCFKLLALYNKFYSNDKYCLLYSKTNEIPTNLESRMNIFRESVSGNLDCEYVNDLNLELDKLINSFKNKFGNMDLFSKVNVRDIRSNNIIEIDGQRQAIEELEFYYFDGIYNIINFESEELISLNTEDVYKMDNKIIILPEIFTKAYNLSSAKNDDYDLKNINKNNIIKSYPQFNNAVDVIVQQSDKNIKRDVAENRIIQFLRDKDSKYYGTILEIISKYRTISETEYNNFKDELIGLLNKKYVSVIPLKNYKIDCNGLDILLREKFNFDFGRGKEYDTKFSNKINDFFKGTQNKVISIVSDIGISGMQFINTINDYVDKMGSYNSDILYKYDGDCFKKNFEHADKIIIVNCLFTNYYEDSIRKFLKDKFNKENIEFKGTKIDISNQYTYAEVHQNCRNKFKEFICKYYKDVFDGKVYKGSDMKYEEYLSIPENESISKEDRCKTIMLLRYKSMPKYHQVVFRERIFDYRKG